MRSIHRLSDKQLQAALKAGFPKRLSDGGNLYCKFHRGSAYWCYDYAIAKRRDTLRLGVYPRVTLKNAREKHHEAIKLVQNGIDPKQKQRKTQEQKQAAAKNKFEPIARDFLSQQQTWSDKHRKGVLLRLQNDAFPWLGATPITEITTSEILKVLRRVEQRGANESAHRLANSIGQIYRYAIASGLCERNLIPD